MTAAWARFCGWLTEIIEPHSDLCNEFEKQKNISVQFCDSSKIAVDEASKTQKVDKYLNKGRFVSGKMIATHGFVETTFTKLTYCAICKQLLWGLKNQGKKWCVQFFVCVGLFNIERQRWMRHDGAQEVRG
jgi:hypothetical protein